MHPHVSPLDVRMYMSMPSCDGKSLESVVPLGFETPKVRILLTCHTPSMTGRPDWMLNFTFVLL